MAGHTQFLAEIFADTLSGVLELLTHERPLIVFDTQAPDEHLEPVTWWEQYLDFSPAGFFIGASQPLQQALAERITPAGADETNTADQFTSILTQTFVSLSQTLSAESGQIVEPVGLRLLTEPPASASTVTLSFVIDFQGNTLPPLWVRCPANLLTSLNHLLEERSNARAADSPAGNSNLPKNDSPGAFDLLMEVELPISVSFGKTSMPLKDVLRLNIGSIVELNRTPAEPVDLLVNNCIIARGEVVVVEGNYGVRVLHVAGRQERLNSLR